MINKILKELLHNSFRNLQYKNEFEKYLSLVCDILRVYIMSSLKYSQQAKSIKCKIYMAPQYG